MIVRQVFRKKVSEMTLTSHDDVVEALPANRADKALDVGALPRCTRSREDFGDAESGDSSAELGAVHGVAISQQVAWRRVPRKRLDDLASRPCGRRMMGDVEMEDPPSVV